MRHNIKVEFRESMDAVHFSRDTKEAMVDTLLAHMEEQESQKKKHGGRKLLLIALAATIVLATLTGAAAFTRWSRSGQALYNPSQQVKEQAEKSGLSVMLENKTEETNPGEVVSVTDQGITVTAVQSIVDNYEAVLTFRIEGFDLPEDKLPWAFWDPDITIDGQHFYHGGSGYFFDGTTRNDAGECVYASNGQPVAIGEDGCLILDYVAADGSMEYIIYIAFEDTSGVYLGKEIAVHFTGFGVQSDERAGMPEILVEGDWELHWTLTGTDSEKTFTPNVEIGDSGITLLEAEIGQKTVRAVYQLDYDWDGYEEMDDLSEDLAGVQMKNGDMILFSPMTLDYSRMEEEHICEVTYRSFRGLLDISQVESLAFHKGWENDENGNPTIQTFDYIPIG